MWLVVVDGEAVRDGGQHAPPHGARAGGVCYVVLEDEGHAHGHDLSLSRLRGG